MSNNLDDKISDYIQDHEMDLLYQYLEDESHWKEFTDWLYANDQHSVLEALFEHFITQGKGREVEKFREWSNQTVYERMASGNEEDIRGDK